jgi:GR25 family glycosyltransferase involved in LPS biosynthesis
MFEKRFVINLPFKTDRLEKFQSDVPKLFGDIQVWPAVHGDSIRHPDWWQSGAGAWGCYRSHLQILEHCYQQGIESYLVFEDDALFLKNFESEYAAFIQELPDDWEMIYLGGQLLHEIQHPPQQVSERVYVPYNVNRTHAFAVHKRGYETVYKHLHDVMQPREHIDHHLGRLHESGRLKLYCPNKWLVGQDGGASNISGQINQACFWVDPEKVVSRANWQNEYMPCVFLQSTMEVAIELERRGWHRGHWQNEERLDRGICNAIASSDLKPGLLQWFKSVAPEAVREGLKCVCLFHPHLSWECVKELPLKDLVKIKASSADDAEEQLKKHIAAHNNPDEQGLPYKHLIYHIYPKKGNGTWQWNVAELIKRIEMFDGMRTIGIATDDTTDSIEEVRKAFENVRIDMFITAKNDPELGEVATFKQMLETLPRDPSSITFYGHAKGTSYDDPNKTRDWTSMLYEVCLDDPKHVDACLKQHPIAGPFTRGRWPGCNRHEWYFSGAFFWFRNHDVFKSEHWKDIKRDRWGVELWPGNLFPLDEAACIFGQHCDHIYDQNVLDHIKEWMDSWKNRRREPECESV